MQYFGMCMWYEACECGIDFVTTTQKYETYKTHKLKEHICKTHVFTLGSPNVTTKKDGKQHERDHTSNNQLQINHKSTPIVSTMKEAIQNSTKHNKININQLSKPYDDHDASAFISLLLLMSTNLVPKTPPFHHFIDEIIMYFVIQSKSNLTSNIWVLNVNSIHYFPVPKLNYQEYISLLLYLFMPLTIII